MRAIGFHGGFANAEGQRVQLTMTTMTPYDLRHVEVIIFLDDLPPPPAIIFRDASVCRL